MSHQLGPINARAQIIFMWRIPSAQSCQGLKSGVCVRGTLTGITTTMRKSRTRGYQDTTKINMDNSMVFLENMAQENKLTPSMKERKLHNSTEFKPRLKIIKLKHHFLNCQEKQFLLGFVCEKIIRQENPHQQLANTSKPT